MNLYPLGDPAALARLWPDLRPFAQMMARRDPDWWPVDEQLRAAVAGEILLWAIADETEGKPYGILATRRERRPSGRSVMVLCFAAGRQHRKWQTLAEETVKAHARETGCALVEVTARDGWQRLSPGWKRVGGLYRMEV